ncbi:MULTISPECIES: hypothetical protein [unclassified Caballeronia]|uniref:hypothetical protein n=1 Tax=unclassified Caballeronia TaxID=2646786 RepID=UPI00286376B9|nr:MULTISPECIES: hypothetical protein [unclassified Caballeronia]MDR5771017.1 hypothetical protein [Caballeronia sp. LZ002]MDR5802481.1 hypothetical protein [Caballeronia sp. LZ001]MDR5846454.1 hypothetical protein [Caballeronia sp. LZ003]
MAELLALNRDIGTGIVEEPGDHASNVLVETCPEFFRHGLSCFRLVQRFRVCVYCFLGARLSFDIFGFPCRAYAFIE